ncbi:unnamed protein product [Rotaria socialis]|uniref:EGF-like domain-containing protein n=1 Tax=Rotaria socialis TaxID=392032 RepID=A0A820RSZ8_9BILA|nr:unnamed protein product [Rotaria socialis]CAF4441979.1 unnamed protein product [Rotaria socialis]
MSSFHYLFIFGNLLLIFISLTKAASLDERCDSNPECIGTGLICHTNLCQCDAPWYKPCNTVCEVQQQSVYEGDTCRVDDNCMRHARCDNSSKKCVCKETFSSFNGLCRKKYNETCAGNDECVSNICDISLRRCTCQDGSEPLNDGRCRRILARLYLNWAQANESKDFCYNDDSCLNILATCRNDGNRMEKFCQCPPNGYTTDFNNQKCIANEIERLSPMNEQTSTDNTTCVFCKDNNAVCANVGNKDTCWCRAGYDKVGNECQNIRYKFIFPTAMDSAQHSFSSTCSINGSIESVQDSLCSCAAYQEYDAATRRCKNIERQWISEHFEYGICTRIKSDAVAQGPINALCPPPLQCRANGDKYVCSCGPNKFLQSDAIGVRCVYRLGKPAENSSCPMNADFINNTCVCKAGYNQVNEDRGCELVLEHQETLADCSTSGSVAANNSCKTSFGGAARYCRPGVCRCDPTISFRDPVPVVCYSLLGVSQPEPNCPPGSKPPNAGTCECKGENRKSNDNRRCDPKSLLYNWNEATVNQADLQRGDCAALYSGWLADFNDTASIKVCQCAPIAFKSPSGVECWPLVYTDLTGSVSACNIPNSMQSITNSRRCECQSGYRPSNLMKRDCVRIPGRLDESIVINIPDVNPITASDCRALFGVLAELNNSRCVCPDDISFANNDGSRCHGILNKPTGFQTLISSDCPQHASTKITGTCQCNEGFVSSADNRICTTVDIPLVGTKEPLSANSCTNFTTDNCIAKYGTDSFCENNQCWCNRKSSFNINDNRCESFSNYIFPGLHERHNVSCDVDADCTRDNVNIDTVECTHRTSASSDYKVCVCKHGLFLNPFTQTCESRCPSDCNNRANSVCNGYNCVCKQGFIEENNTCVPVKEQIQLYKPCNSSFVATENIDVTCSSCNRGECAFSYRDTGFQCAKFNFDNDRCVTQGPNVCNALIGNSRCFEEENKCVCESGYYRDENLCALSVDSRCTTPEQCGSNGICSGQRCRCAEGKRVQNAIDAFGRSIQRCINDNTNGADQIRFSFISVLFFICVRIFFI